MPLPHGSPQLSLSLLLRLSVWGNSAIFCDLSVGPPTPLAPLTGPRAHGPSSLPAEGGWPKTNTTGGGGGGTDPNPQSRHHRGSGGQDPPTVPLPEGQTHGSPRPRWVGEGRFPGPREVSAGGDHTIPRPADGGPRSRGPG